MTTYLGEKAVGVGTVKATMSVGKVITDDKTIIGDGFTEPLAVNTLLFATSESVAASAEAVRAESDKKYIKKSGDTMTGDLVFEDYSAAHPQKHVLHGDSSFSIEYYYNNEQYPRQTWNFAGASFFASSTTGVKPFLGHPTHPWENVYAKKLNNGADISVPTLGGTLARIEDIQNATTTLNAAIANIEHKIPDGTTGTNSLINKQILAQTSYTKAEVDAKVSSVYKFKGSVSTYNSLPSTATTGDVYNVTDTGANYAWDGSKWDKLSETIDLTAYATTEYVTAREQDIRSDLGETISEVHEQVVGLSGEVATAISGKQDKLTAGENITIEDGVISATGGGGASLPDQTGNTGKFLMTDGANVSWGDALVNTYTSTYRKSLVITPDNIPLNKVSNGGIYLVSSSATLGTFVAQSEQVVIGSDIAASAASTVTIGSHASNKGYDGSIAIGASSGTSGDGSQIAIGYHAKTAASYAIQLGKGTNSDANTFKVGLSNSNNYELLSADGTIPAARHATLPTEDGTYVLKCVISGGVPTMTWVKE